MIDKLIKGAAKKKGRDGKACWKGYTLRGTKKKGGRTVDALLTPLTTDEA